MAGAAGHRLHGGTEIALGVLAYLAVRDATGSALLGGLAFSIGLLALLLVHSELFTEDFLVPVTTVVAKRATWGQLAKLWIGLLVMNLLGRWSVMWVVTVVFPGCTTGRSRLQPISSNPR